MRRRGGAAGEGKGGGRVCEILGQKKEETQDKTEIERKIIKFLSGIDDRNS